MSAPSSRLKSKSNKKPACRRQETKQPNKHIKITQVQMLKNIYPIIIILRICTWVFYICVCVCVFVCLCVCVCVMAKSLAPIASNENYWWTKKWNGCGKKRSFSDFMYYPDNFVKKATVNLSQDSLPSGRDLNSRTPEYEAGLLPFFSDIRRVRVTRTLVWTGACARILLI
jgi:hypothetical protein